MTQEKIAFLVLVLLGGLGAVLFIVGVLIKVFTDRKNIRCTARTFGKVIKHTFNGGSQMSPVVEYEVDGKNYICSKKFNGILTVHSSLNKEPDAWEDDKGYLHVRTGPYTNLRALAQKLWPVDSYMNVYYDPDNPKISYADRPIKNFVLYIIFLATGLGIVVLGIFLYFLIR